MGTITLLIEENALSLEKYNELFQNANLDVIMSEFWENKARIFKDSSQQTSLNT